MAVSVPIAQSLSASLALLRTDMHVRSLEPEMLAVERVLKVVELGPVVRAQAEQVASALVAGARARQAERPILDVFLQEFGLSNKEGIALMCIAEALLRIPDDATADRLIAEKLKHADWRAHRGNSSSLFVNASTWALMLTGHVVAVEPTAQQDVSGWLSALSQRLGEAAVRLALRRAMRIIGGEFVVGRTIDEALARCDKESELHLCSFDMLGEGARTRSDAQRYRDAYHHALSVIAAVDVGLPHAQRSGMSIKLSALEPRYDLAHRDLVMTRLVPIVIDLARQAANAGIGLTIDAEEADRLELSLDVFEAVARDAATLQWSGLGLVVQAYGKRATQVIEWLAALARDCGRCCTVRLVKGAYWDAEIKRAQERGLLGYPVFTRKVTTDAAYLACAANLFRHAGVIYPQFATHNAHTIAAILQLRPRAAPMEFQRLHGMGRLLYAQAQRQIEEFPSVRVYAPVGRHEDLLAYLVRRLLENGANTSFINRFMDERLPVASLVADPFTVLGELTEKSHPHIPLPTHLYGSQRKNSVGIDWGDSVTVKALEIAVRDRRDAPHHASAIVGGVCIGGEGVEVRSPGDHRHLLGLTHAADAATIHTAFTQAAQAQPQWNRAGAHERAQCLLRAAELLIAQRHDLLALLVYEAGKTLPDAIAELREAEDYCRYYAAQAVALFGTPLHLPGPTGEDNQLVLHGRGVLACISPWNFPLAIFMGQVTAALAAGNAVVAKPAGPTTLIAAAAVRLLHAAGLPLNVLQLTPAPGKLFGDVGLQHPALAGVAFTGSLDTAQHINRLLAARDGPIVPLIAETGGLNAMIVDSSALLEQVIDDVVASAFTSAGQRCSALRLLFLQEDIAEQCIELLVGAMDELVIGDPTNIATDVGPVITDAARASLARHSEQMRGTARVLKECCLDERHQQGSFFAPCLYELTDAAQLTREQFGPILHVVRFKSGQLQQVLASIRASGFGLTLGIHSRIENVWHEVLAGTGVGNNYVNRNMVGAVVGVQPFGGEGLSGTGPKAGGPHYLLRFATERTVTINTVATGGNASLLSMDDGA